MRLKKTKWSSVVGGGFSIILNGKQYEAMIIGSTDGMDEEVDTKICEIIIDAVNTRALQPVDDVRVHDIAVLRDALESLDEIVNLYGDDLLDDFDTLYFTDRVKTIRKALMNTEGEKKCNIISGQ